MTECPGHAEGHNWILHSKHSHFEPGKPYRLITKIFFALVPIFGWVALGCGPSNVWAGYEYQWYCSRCREWNSEIKPD